MAYYASTSNAQYYYPEDDQKGFDGEEGKEEEEEARGRQPFSYISHGSSVSDTYGEGPYGYCTQPEEDEEAYESEELICKLAIFLFHLLVRQALEAAARFVSLMLLSRFSLSSRYGPGRGFHV